MRDLSVEPLAQLVPMPAYLLLLLVLLTLLMGAFGWIMLLRGMLARWRFADRERVMTEAIESAITHLEVDDSVGTLRPMALDILRDALLQKATRT